MITNAILSFFANIYQFLVSGFTSIVDIVNSINKGIEAFFEFSTPILEYALWFFNLPVLEIALALTALFFSILVAEYSIKLVVKYVTRLL